jgi:nucleotide-binding universal stress UspA family protein
MDKESEMYKSILVPTDGSRLSGKAVAEAIRLAMTCHAKITVLNVVSDFRKAVSETYAVPAAMAAPVQKKFQDDAAIRSRKILDETCAEATTAGIGCAGVSVVSDSPYEAIIKQAAKSKCDVIVMASHGRKGLQGFLLGSETTKVLCHSKIPVLVVR